MTIKSRKFVKGIRLKATDSAASIDGEIRNDLSNARFKVYIESAERELITADQTQTLTNKGIDADNNTIANIETDNLKAGVLVTDISAATSDTELPSALAVKTALDGQNEASEITYDNSTSGLTATDVQAAIDEVEGRVDTNETNIGTNTTDIGTNATNLTNHEADTSTHGVTTVAGISETQTLTNKSIDSSTNTLTIPLNDLSDVDVAGATDGQIVTYQIGSGNFEAVDAPVSTTLSVKGDIQGFSTQNASLPVGSNDQIIVADSTQPLGVRWTDPVNPSPTTTEGDIIINDGGGAASDAALAIGSTGQVLRSNGTTLAYDDTSEVNLTTKGDIQTYDTDNQRLAVGSDGSFLVADSSEPTGLKYSDSLSGTLNPVSNSVSYTPTFNGFGSITNIDFTYQIIGDQVRIIGEFVAGTNSGVEGQFTLPNSYTVKGGTIKNVGTYIRGGTNTGSGGMILATDGDAFLNFSDNDVFSNVSLNPAAAANDGSIASSGQKVLIDTMVSVNELSSGTDAIARNVTNQLFTAVNNSGQGITSGVTDVPFIETSDPNNNWDGDSYTVTEDTDLIIFGSVAINAATMPEIDLYVDGVSHTSSIGNNSGGNYGSFYYRGSFLAGEVVSIRLSGGRTLLSTGRHTLNITTVANNKTVVSVANKTQTKYLSAAVSTNKTITEWQFDNLVIGKLYSINLNYVLSHSNSTSNTKAGRVEIAHDGANLIYSTNSVNSVTFYGEPRSHTKTFVATATTVTALTAGMTNTTISDSTDRAWLTLTELNHSSETTDF